MSAPQVSPRPPQRSLGQRETYAQKFDAVGDLIFRKFIWDFQGTSEQWKWATGRIIEIRHFIATVDRWRFDP